MHSPVTAFGRQKTVRFLIFFFFSAITLVASTEVHADSAPVAVRIGVVTDLSGPLAEWGGYTGLAARILRKETGYTRLQFIFGDSQFKSTKAASEVRKMLDVDKPDAFFIDFSVAALAASPLLRDAQVIGIHNSTSAEANRINPFFFKTYLDYEAGCRLVAEKWKKLGVSKAAALRFNGEIGERCASGALSVFPSLEIYPFNSEDSMDPPASIMKSKKIEAVFTAAFWPDISNFLKAVEKVHFKPRLGGAEGDLLVPQIKGRFEKALNTATAFGFKSPPEDFQKTARRESAGVPIQDMAFVFVSYIHLKQLYRAVTRCPGRDLDCEMKELAASPPEEDLGFKGFMDRSAVYEMGLRQ